MKNRRKGNKIRGLNRAVQHTTNRKSKKRKLKSGNYF